MQTSYLLLAILTAAFATFATRVLPFLLFDKKQKPNKWLGLFEKNMPLMIMVILVFYAIRNTNFNEYPYGISEIIGIMSALLLHVKFKNALLSIIGATLFYMLLIGVIFQ
ncbi:MAG: AzlD domain-containing protein [Campylobacteraceae bacterium]|jgi:branched-subunit amino acid transport protein AzlD|nr:AzlD domain-containing protein [Campylobacteraceae bacterium]